LILGKETNSTYLGNDWYSLNGGFEASGVKNFTTWSSIYNKEKQNGKIVGLNIDPEFKGPGNTVLTSPEQLDKYDQYELPGNSALQNGGLDLKQLFKIETGNKSLNGKEAPAKGIGAIF
jgi:hypothetical protein